MLLAKIKISSRDNTISKLASGLDVRVEIVRCRANGSIGGLSILRIESGTGTIAEDIKRWFTRSGGCSVVSIASVSPGRHLVTIKNTSCKLCKALVGTDCFLESGSCAESDAVIWKVFAPNNNSIKGMIEELRNEGCLVELLSVKKAVSSFELTQIQDEAMRLAYSMGYYDIPKRVRLDELAARSGISKATLNLILRRGQKKILAERMDK